MARGEGHQGEKDAVQNFSAATNISKARLLFSFKSAKKSVTGYLIILSLLTAFFLWTECRPTVFMCNCTVLVINSNSQHLKKEVNKLMNGCVNANQHSASGKWD